MTPLSHLSNSIHFPSSSISLTSNSISSPSSSSISSTSNISPTPIPCFITGNSFSLDSNDNPLPIPNLTSYLRLFNHTLKSSKPLSVRSCLKTTSTTERSYLNTTALGDIFPSPLQLLHQATWHKQFLEVRASKLIPSELGVFAMRPIPAGTNLGYYSGTVNKPYSPLRDQDVNDYLVGFHTLHNNLYQPMTINGKSLLGCMTQLGVLGRINEYIWCANPDRRRDLNNCRIIAGSPGLIRTTKRISEGTELMLTLGTGYDWTSYHKHLALRTVAELMRYNDLFICQWKKLIIALQQEVQLADITAGIGSARSKLIIQHVRLGYSATANRLPDNLIQLDFDEWILALLNYRPFASTTVFRYANKPGMGPMPQPLSSPSQPLHISDDIRHQLRPYQKGDDPRSYWTNDNLITQILEHIGQSTRRNTTLALPGFAEATMAHPHGANLSYLHVSHRVKLWHNTTWLAVPLLVRSNHWIFLVIHLPTALVYVGDSLYLDLQDILEKFLNHLARILLEISGKRPRSWIVRRLLLPKQLNSYDCGVHVCHNISSMVQGRTVRPLTSSSLRQRVLHDLSTRLPTKSTKLPCPHSYWFRHLTQTCYPPQLIQTFLDLTTQSDTEHSTAHQPCGQRQRSQSQTPSAADHATTTEEKALPTPCPPGSRIPPSSVSHSKSEEFTMQLEETPTVAQQRSRQDHKQLQLRTLSTDQALMTKEMLLLTPPPMTSNSSPDTASTPFSGNDANPLALADQSKSRYAFTKVHLASLATFCKSFPPPQIDDRSTTRIATLNIRRLTKDKILPVSWYIHQYDIDILFLIDTQIRPNERRLYTQYFRAILPHDTVLHSPLHPSSYTTRVGFHTGGISCIITDKCARNMSPCKQDSLQLGVGLAFTLNERNCKLHLGAVYWPSVGTDGLHQLRNRMTRALEEHTHHTTPDLYLQHMIGNWMPKRPDDRFILCGDFNCEWMSARLHWTRDQGLCNLASACDRPTFYRSPTSLQRSRIDHIIGTPMPVAIATISDDIGWAHDTDHRPLMVEISSNWVTPPPTQYVPRYSTTRFPTNTELIEQFQSTLLELQEREDSYQDISTIMEESVRTAQALTRSGGRVRTHHYDGWSPTYACLRLKHDYLIQLRKLILRRKLRLRLLSTLPQACLLVAQWRSALNAYSSLPDFITADLHRPEHWLTQHGHELLRNVPSELKATLALMHGKKRSEYRRDIAGRVKRMEEERLAGRPGLILRGLCGSSKQFFDLDSIGTPADKLLHQPADVHNALTDAMHELYRRQDNAPLSALPLDISSWTEPTFQATLDSILPAQLKWTIPYLWRGFTVYTNQPGKKYQDLCAFTSTHLSKPPTFTAFDEKLSRIKAKTAPGLSGVSYQMMRAWPTEIRRRVHSALVDLWHRGVTPPLWDYRLLVLIPKGDGPLTTSTMRPLTLLEPLRKLWVGLLCKPLYKKWDEDGILSPLQWGYRRGRDTSIPTSAIHAAFERCRLHNLPCTLSSFDIKKAFDSVSLHMLQLSYSRMGVPLQFAQRLLDLDMKGKTIVRTPHATHSLRKRGMKCLDLKSSSPNRLRYFVPERGMGQGDVPSAPLWNAFFDTLAKTIEALTSDKPHILTQCLGSNGPIPLVGSIYADDYVQLSFSAERLQLVADVVSAWAITVGATIAPDKIRTLSMPADVGHPLTLTASSNTTTVALAPTSATCPYLGVLYSSSGQTQTHLQSLRSKLHIMIGRLRLRTRSYSATSIALAVALKINTKAAYVIARSPFTLSQLQLLATPLNILLRKCTLNGHGFPTRLLYLPAQLGGLGLPSLIDAGVKQKLSILMRGLFDGGYAGNIMDAILYQELLTSVTPTPGYRYRLPPSIGSSWMAALSQYANEANCFLWYGGMDTHTTSEIPIASLGIPTYAVQRARSLGITTVSDIITHDDNADLATLGLSDLYPHIPAAATLHTPYLFKPGQFLVPLRAPHLMHEVVTVLRDTLLVRLWSNESNTTITLLDQLSPHERCTQHTDLLQLAPTTIGQCYRAYLASTNTINQRQVRLIHTTPITYATPPPQPAPPWMLQIRTEIQHFLEQRPEGADYCIVTDGSWKKKSNDIYDILATHASTLRAHSNGSMVVMYWDGSRYKYRAYSCNLQHTTYSAFEVELYMVCLAGLLSTHNIHTDCKSVVQTISDKTSTRGRLTSRVGQLLWLASRLRLGPRLKHCAAHPERNTTLSAWTLIQHGIYLADHYASFNTPTPHSLINRELVTGTHTTLPNNPVHEAIEHLPGWYWGDAHGRVIFEDLIERYHCHQAAHYTTTRDTYPRRQNDTRPRWSSCHPAFCATAHRLPTLPLMQRAALVRLVWDKYHHGRIRGLYDLTDSSLRCPHCGELDSRAHIILKCMHAPTRDLRYRALDKCEEILQQQDYSPNTICIGRRLVHLAGNHIHGDYIWCGMLTDDLLHHLFSTTSLPTGPNFKPCQQLILLLCKTLSDTAHEMIRDSLTTHRCTTKIVHPRTTSHLIPSTYIPRWKPPQIGLHLLHRNPTYRTYRRHLRIGTPALEIGSALPAPSTMDRRPGCAASPGPPATKLIA